MTGKTYQLPTEAEWEYAARGGVETQKLAYKKYTRSNNIDEVAWYENNNDNKTHPVATKQPNELGIYDMSGNVWEWCTDWYDTYLPTAQTNPKGPATGSYRVIRGGSWINYAQNCRSTFRNSCYPNSNSIALGFRVVFVP